MARLIDKLKQYVSPRHAEDVAPPELNVPTGINPALRPARPLRGEAPRGGAQLQGSVNSPNNRDQVFDRPDERTEELLVLTEDALLDAEDNGIDPYNTGNFRTSGLWRRN